MGEQCGKFLVGWKGRGARGSGDVRCASLGGHLSPRWTSSASSVKGGKALHFPSWGLWSGWQEFCRNNFLVGPRRGRGHAPGYPAPQPERGESDWNTELPGLFTEGCPATYKQPSSNPGSAYTPGICNKWQCTLKALNPKKSSGERLRWCLHNNANVLNTKELCP